MWYGCEEKKRLDVAAREVKEQCVQRYNDVYTAENQIGTWREGVIVLLLWPGFVALFCITSFI